MNSQLTELRNISQQLREHAQSARPNDQARQDLFAKLKRARANFAKNYFQTFFLNSGDMFLNEEYKRNWDLIVDQFMEDGNDWDALLNEEGHSLSQ